MEATVVAATSFGRQAYTEINMPKIIKSLLLVIALSGCDNSGTPPLQTTLILRDKFSQESSHFTQGEPIEFVLTSTNTTNEPITLHFNSAQQFDFYIKPVSDTEIWRWSDDMTFATALTSFTLPAHGTEEAAETWAQTLATGGNIPTGNYTAYGSFLDRTPIAQFSFTIQ